MTHKQTIKKLHKLFGGTFKLVPSRNPRKHRDNYEWYVGDLDTINVLNRIGCYLVTKKKQAELLLRFRQTCFPVRKVGRGVTCSPALVKRRASYFNKLRELNKRGVDAK